MFWTIVVFLALGLLAAFFSSVPIQLPDTPTYVPIPGQNAFSQVSLVGNAQRPWVVTLPYAAIANYQRIVMMQIAASLVSWAILLWSTSFLRIRSMILTWTVRVVIASIGLSSLVIIWNSYLQSDSLAMTGTALLIAGFLIAPTRLVLGPFLLVSGALIASQIRIATGPPILLMAALLLITPVHEFVKKRTVTPAKLVSASITVVLVILTLLYSTVLNTRMDMDWGNNVRPGSNLHGRTLQQIDVINMTTWGNRAIVDILASDKFTCLQKEFPLGRPGVYWRPFVVGKCPRQATLFSEQFPSQYSAWILHHPRLVATSLIGPYNQSFSIPSAATSLSFPPDSLLMLWATGVSGANPVILGLMLLVVADVWMMIRRRPGSYEVMQLTIVACGGFASVLLTVIGSPSDTQRVGSAPAMIARLFVIFGLIVFVDRCLVRDRSTGTSPRHSIRQ